MYDNLFQFPFRKRVRDWTGCGWPFDFRGVVREFEGLCLVGGGGGIISGVTVVGFFWGW